MLSRFLITTSQKPLDRTHLLCYTNHDNTTKDRHTTTTNATTNWLDYLSGDVHLRLAQCQTTKDDLPILLNAKWRWAQDTGHYNGYTKADMLSDILDLLNCNGLDSVTELTIEEWRNLTK